MDNGFKPLYVVVQGKKERVTKLKALLKDASELYLATDEDREGESIAWHLLEVLNPRVPVKRMVFHEITREAIRRAVDNWRDLDRRLVDAQETRRILDRLYGYEVSPVLWRKVLPRLSAGRVQSVATRLLVERERARMRFRAASYWDVSGRFRADRWRASAPCSSPSTVPAWRRDGTSARTASSAGATSCGWTSPVPGGWRTGSRRPSSPYAVSTKNPGDVLPTPRSSPLRSSRRRGASCGSPPPARCGWPRTSTKRATSPTCAPTARRCPTRPCRPPAVSSRDLYGTDYLPAAPRRYEKRVKNAQEAHEAIRPAGDEFRHPERSGLSGDQLRLYDLIWKRTVASQMSDAQGLSVQVRLAANSSRGEDAEFAANGRVVNFPGFLRAYVEGSDDPEAELEDREVRLPRLVPGEAVTAEALVPEGHTTQPPARYTEASLVKALEELGVGRPSTYATIMDTVQSRGYVWKKGTALVPSWTAFAVVGLLEQHFANLVDYGFTAQMEEDLDGIARGDEEPLPWLTRFYFGSPGGKAEDEGLKRMVAERLADIDARAVNSIPVGDPSSGVVVRVGRFGPYVQEGERRASLPEELAPDELTVERGLPVARCPYGRAGRPGARPRPGHGPSGAGTGRALRPVHPVGAGRRAEHQTEDVVAALEHGARRGYLGGRPPPAHSAPQAREGH